MEADTTVCDEVMEVMEAELIAAPSLLAPD